MDKATYTCESCDWNGTMDQKTEVPAPDGFGNRLICPVCGHDVFYIDPPKYDEDDADWDEHTRQCEADERARYRRLSEDDPIKYNHLW